MSKNKLSSGQLDLLKLMAQAHGKGLYWIPPQRGSEYLESENRWITVQGSGDASAIRALWRKGLASHIELVDFSSEITKEGLKALNDN